MKVIIEQPYGLGDLLFLQPLVNLIEADKILWPIIDHYLWIEEYVEVLPNVDFVKLSEFNPSNYPDYTVIPFQYAHLHKPDSEDCMKAKYDLLGANLELWRELSFHRNYEREERLLHHLNIKPEDRFILVNNNFAEFKFNYKLDIKLKTDLKIVYLDFVEGFTLLDWCGVLVQAQEIHTVCTSLFFVVEALRLQQPTHLYPRKPFDKDLSSIKSLINNKWICHE